MQSKSLINLKVLLPFCIFATKTGVTSIVADTIACSLGILPNRMDCVTALTPGILVYETRDEGERYIAVDKGILIKTGYDVLVSVRNAIGGLDLRELQATVEREYMVLNEREQKVKSVISKMESAFIHQIAAYGHE